MAIIIKRLSVEDQGADRHEVIAEVKQIITGGNLQMVMHITQIEIHILQYG
jgi:hypothetical protein